MRSDNEFQQLLAEARAGSEPAAQQLVEEYLPHVLQVVRRSLNRKLRTKFDSMDFAQAVWASVLGCREQLAQIESGEAWAKFLATIARNKVIDEIRRRMETEKYQVDRECSMSDLVSAARDGRTIAQQMASREPSPSQAAIANERFEQLTAGLSEQQREIVRLKMEGETCQAVADRLGINERTVRRLLKRLELE